MYAAADDFGTEKAPLVLLPGTLCDARVFAPLLARLPARPWSLGDMHGLETVAGLAERLLERAPRSFALLGFSLGAIVALEVAARAPERVAGLALIGGNAHALAPHDRDRRRAEIGAVASVDTYVGETMWPSYAGRRQDERLRRTLVAMGEACPDDALRMQTEVALSRADSRPRLAALTMPSLIIAGADDSINDATIQRGMAAAIPRAKLALVPDAGHFVLLEQPDACARAVTDWLADVDAEPAFAYTPFISAGELS